MIEFCISTKDSLRADRWLSFRAEFTRFVNLWRDSCISAGSPLLVLPIHGLMLMQGYSSKSWSCKSSCLKTADGMGDSGSTPKLTGRREKEGERGQREGGKMEKKNSLVVRLMWDAAVFRYRRCDVCCSLIWSALLQVQPGDTVLLQRGAGEVQHRQVQLVKLQKRKHGEMRGQIEKNERAKINSPYQ